MEFNWKETKLPAATCPYCNSKNDAASSPEGHTPEPGHYAVCNNCASLLKFGENMELEPVFPDEINYLNNKYPRFMQKMSLMQAAVQALRREKEREWWMRR